MSDARCLCGEVAWQSAYCAKCSVWAVSLAQHRAQTAYNFLHGLSLLGSTGLGLALDLARLAAARSAMAELRAAEEALALAIDVFAQRAEGKAP